jgi:hypothetical protein
MNQELIITLAVLLFEIVLFGICYLRAKQPPNPAKPRLLPYGLIMMFLFLAGFVTVAHTIGVITGHRIEARNKMKGQN